MRLKREDLSARRCLIIHGDDLGMSHSINQANFEALKAEAITSVSVMAPCPWIPEVADFFRRHTGVDVGFHLTLTNECIKYRWRPMSRSAQESGLADLKGFMHQSVEDLLSTACTIEDEIRSQRFALESCGLTPTHLDCHMYAAFRSPSLLRDYVRSAVETNTIAQVPSWRRAIALEYADNMTELIPAVNIIGIDPSIPAELWTEFYLNVIDKLPIGLNVLLVHLGYDTAELRAVREGIPGWDAPWRQRDFGVVMSKRFRDSLLYEDILLLSWSRVVELLRS